MYEVGVGISLNFGAMKKIDKVINMFHLHIKFLCVFLFFIFLRVSLDLSLFRIN